MGAHGNRAPWDMVGSTGSSRARERTGRLSFGGKGKRRTVQAYGVPVPQPSDSVWLAREGMREQPAMRYGTGASVRDFERSRGLAMSDHERLAGERAKATLTATPVFVTSRVPVMVTREDGSQKYTYAIARYQTGEVVTKPQTSKPDPRDRIAREAVAADRFRARSRERIEKQEARLYSNLRKVLGG